MQGNIRYILDFIKVSEDGDIAEFDSDLYQLIGEPVIYGIDLYIEPAEQIQALNMIKTWTNTRQYIQWRSGIETLIEIEQQLTTLMIMGVNISVIIWLIGVFNFINIITTSILARRHEIALLESIGQSLKQSKKMLMSEGAIYAVITLLLVSIFGGSIIYILFSLLASQYDYLVFSLPYIPLLFMGCVVFAVCLSVPRLTYWFVSKMTLVERLREVE
jgi:putative ABC transport system permease protein